MELETASINLKSRFWKDSFFWFCIILGAGIMLLCSRSSPLYPLNDWVDSNCFFTVGRSILAGEVPYRDIYEQKGPLLYFLHAFAALISNNSFFGVYLLESVMATLFLYSSWKILKVYSGKLGIILLPVLAVLVYTSTSFYSGDSAEEFCLPFYAICIAISICAYQQGKEIPTWGFFVAGIMSGCVLWIKYTMLGFFVGWFILPAFLAIRKGKWAKLCKMILSVLAGVAAVSLPIILYFVWNKSLGDLWQVYFYNNMFLYANVDVSESASFLSNLINVVTWTGLSVFRTLRINWLYGIPILAGVIWVIIKEPKRIKLHLALMFIFTCFTVYAGGRGYFYYGFILAAFAPFGLIPIARLLQKFQLKKLANACLATGILALSLLLVWKISPNSYFMSYEKEELPQYKFAEIIDAKADSTMLNYGFLDGGFYLAAERLPTTRFFCYLNIPLDDLMASQNKIVYDGAVDFVVTREEPLQSEQYDCVATADMLTDGENYTYYLYKLKGSTT